MRLAVRHGIIDDPDSKPANLDRQFRSDSNPATDLSRRSQFRSNFDRFWSKFDLFWLKDRFRDRKSQLNDWKSRLNDRKSQFISKNWFISKNLIYFDLFTLFFDLNRIFRYIYGPNLNWIVTTSTSDSWNRIVKVHYKTIWIRFKMKFGLRSIRWH